MDPRPEGAQRRAAVSDSRPARSKRGPNVGPAERWLSLAVGLAALWLTRRRSGSRAWAVRAAGSALLARAASGCSELYRALGIDTAHARAGRETVSVTRPRRRARQTPEPGRRG